MIKLHYWKQRTNFGDLLSPLLIERVLGKRVTYAPLHRAEMLALGSLMQVLMPQKQPFQFRSRIAQTGLRLAPSREPLHIWGSGALHPDLIVTPLRPLEIHALRGAKSLQLFSPERPRPLGDPGILTNLMIQGAVQKKFRIGVVAHYHDKASPWLEWMRTNLQGVTVIDVEREPLSVVQDIRQCDCILSSSLHGLIVADCYGIPNQWVMFPGSRRASERWKYEDYYSVYPDMPLPEPWMASPETAPLFLTAPLQMQSYARSGIEKIQQSLLKSFPL